MSIGLPRDPAFAAALDRNSPEAVRRSLREWTTERQALMDPIMAPYEQQLCDEISCIQRVLERYESDRIEQLAHMFGLAAQACSDLEAAWQCLRSCFLRTAHAAMRSAIEATFTAVTFADPDDGPRHTADYVADRVRVSGVSARFRATAAKLGTPQGEIDYLEKYLSDWLHPLTHPAAKSMHVTIIQLPGGGIAIGNYFDDSMRSSYEATAINIGYVARRLRVLFQLAAPTAYLYFKP